MSETETAPVVPETTVPDATPETEVQAESSPAPEDAPEKPAEEKKPHWATKRIDELTRNWREAERRNDELIGLLQGRAQPEPAKPETAPTLEAFDFVDQSKYQAAVFEFARKQAEAAADSRIQAWQQQQAAQQRVQSFKSREADFAKNVEDYADAVYDPTAPISAPMAEVIQESDVGPQLAYYLAKNRGEAAQIAQMSPVAAARALGRIEAKLSAPAPKPVAPKAPPPPPKIEATDAEVDADPEKMSIEQWVKWREKQLRKKR